MKRFILFKPFYIIYTSLKMFMLNLAWLLIECNLVYVWSLNEGKVKWIHNRFVPKLYVY